RSRRLVAFGATVKSSTRRRISGVAASIGLLVLAVVSTPYIAVNATNVLSVHHLASPSWLADLARAPTVGGLRHLTDAQARGLGLRAAAAGRLTEAISWYSEVSPADPVSSARESDLRQVQGEPGAAMQILADAHGDR